MGVFATGKYALAICDRCGQQYKFSQLQQEWNGLKTCPECFETKHPQLERQKHAADAQSLQDARPARVEPLIVFVGGAGFFDYNDSMQPATDKKQPTVVSSIGTVSVSTS